MEKFELKERIGLLGKCAIMQPLRWQLSREKATRLPKAPGSVFGLKPGKQIQTRKRGGFQIPRCRPK